MTDYELIKSGDMAELKRRYQSYVHRLASAFAHNQPAVVDELTERTFREIASQPFTGEFAFRDGQPTVKEFITHTLIVQWSEMIRQRRAQDTAKNVLTSSDADSAPLKTGSVPFEMDTDTGFHRET